MEPDIHAEAGMPLQGMFRGACFGSFKDRNGINRMINCAAKA